MTGLTDQLVRVHPRHEVAAGSSTSSGYNEAGSTNHTASASTTALQANSTPNVGTTSGIPTSRNVTSGVARAGNPRSRDVATAESFRGAFSAPRSAAPSLPSPPAVVPVETTGLLVAGMTKFQRGVVVNRGRGNIIIPAELWPSLPSPPAVNGRGARGGGEQRPREHHHPSRALAVCEAATGDHSQRNTTTCIQSASSEITVTLTESHTSSTITIITITITIITIITITIITIIIIRWGRV
ncbi:unnamed protein product [Closterium sp. NIES-54]